MMHVTAACRWHVGKCRTKNEDNFYFAGKSLQNVHQQDSLKYNKALSQRGIAVAVFDGMGGLSDGEKASQMATVSFGKAIERLRAPISEVTMKDICLQMDFAVGALSEKAEKKMGTTAAILALSKNTAIIGNVGDSSIFLFRNNMLTCITKEHSDRRLIERLGIVGRTPALTQYIGAGTKEVPISPYATTRRIAKTDRFLLCSDGLTGMLSGTQIAEICKNTSNTAACADALIEAALDMGGRDNVTIIVCDIM